MKIKLKTFGGDFGSGRKMWWISGLTVYLSCAGALDEAARGSDSRLNSKTFELYGSDEPKEAMTRRTSSARSLARSGRGISLRVCGSQTVSRADQWLSGAMARTNHFNLCLAIVLDAEGVRVLQPTVAFDEGQKDLVRRLSFGPFLRRQGQFEGVRGAQCDGCLARRCRG